MPDLTREYYLACDSVWGWSMTFAGSNGEVYTVEHGVDIETEWQCSCPAFKFSKNRMCKHIKQAMPLYCGWEQFYTGEADKNGMCPKCNGGLHTEAYGV